MSHQISGDWGLEHPSFGSFVKLPLPRSLGGSGLGLLSLEPRWWLTRADGEQVAEVILSDLPPEARAGFDGLPCEGDSIGVPMPFNLNVLAAWIHERMVACRTQLKKAFPGWAGMTVALTPCWRLRPHEVERAIELVNGALSDDERIDRAWLVDRKSDDFPLDDEEIEERFESIEDPLVAFLLVAAAWLVWKDDPRGVVFEDDAALYERKARGRARTYWSSNVESREKSVAQVKAWFAKRAPAAANGDGAALDEIRNEVLAWTCGLPLGDGLVCTALVVAAYRAADLGDFERAQVEASWAVVLHDCGSARNARGYAHHLARDLGSAIVEYTRALEHDPKSTMYLTNRAEAWLDRGDPARSGRDACHALTTDAGCSTARHYLRESLRALGFAEDPAHVALLEAASAKADEAELERLRADCLLRVHDAVPPGARAPFTIEWRGAVVEVATFDCVSGGAAQTYRALLDSAAGRTTRRLVLVARPLAPTGNRAVSDIGSVMGEGMPPLLDGLVLDVDGDLELARLRPPDVRELDLGSDVTLADLRELAALERLHLEVLTLHVRALSKPWLDALIEAPFFGRLRSLALQTAAPEASAAWLRKHARSFERLTRFRVGDIVVDRPTRASIVDALGG
jgi:hypothetical protein